MSAPVVFAALAGASGGMVMVNPLIEVDGPLPEVLGALHEAADEVAE